MADLFGYEKEERGPKVTDYRHDAYTKGHTLFPKQVYDPATVKRVLMPGENNEKIGGVVTKGRWKGMVIYTLTLEERATCPRSCKHWVSCYGRNMPYAHRFAHGSGLERRLADEIANLAIRHPQGFVVRLHILGDFYSVEYVQLWESMLTYYDQLHVFGYTARGSSEVGGGIGVSCPIAQYLVRMRETYPDRWCVRFSNGGRGSYGTASIEHPYQAPDDSIICPEQTGQSKGCSDCGLCWTTPKRIAFIQH